MTGSAAAGSSATGASAVSASAVSAAAVSAWCGRAVAVPGHLLRRHLALAGRDAVGDRLHDQAARADRVVVAGNDVVGLVRITVRVDERDDRHAETASLAHGELLLLQVDDEDRVGLPAQVGDAAEVRLELLELLQHRDPLLRREQVELALALETAQLVQVRDPVGDRAPVRQQAAEPAVRDVRHPDAAGLLRDGVLRLLLRADEEDRAAALGQVAREVVRLLQQLGGLGQVDDVDAAALGEDEALHLRVPATGLVTEVDAGLQEVTHRYDCQGNGPFHGCFAEQPAGRGRNRLPESGTPTRPGRRDGGLRPAQCSGAQACSRARASASARSSGSGDSTSTGSPVNGCANASLAACRN